MADGRIVTLLDMDCFYVQVHQKQEPSTWGTPCAVVQYTGGGVIAVNYEAREYGVKRGFRVDQCKASCPSIKLFMVPELRGKADLTIYRNASIEVLDILTSYDEKIVVERASIDEAFLDLTEFIADIPSDHPCLNEDVSFVHVAGVPPYTIDNFSNATDGDDKTEETAMIISAKVMSTLKRAIKEKTGFACSCGISRNKIMAKLACGFKKPNGLSIFPKAGLDEVWKKTPIKKVRNLGGKLGSHLMSHFQVEMMSDLSSLTQEQLESSVGTKSAEWIVGILKGNDDEPVSSRLIAKSVGCGKNFNVLRLVGEVKHWVTQLASELVERLVEDQKVNQRRARSMVFSIRFKKNFENFTKTLPILDYKVELITDELMKTVTSKFSNQTYRLSEPICSLYITASKFIDEDVYLKSAVNQTARLDRYFTSIDKSALIHETSPSKSFNDISTKPSVSAICEDSTGSVNDDEEGITVDEIMILDDDEEENEMEDCMIDEEEEEGDLNVQNSFFYRKTLQLIMNKDIDPC